MSNWPEFSDEEVQEAIAALKREFPDIWGVLHSCMRNPFADNDEKLACISRAKSIAFRKLSFVARTIDPYRAEYQLSAQVDAVASAEVRRLTAN